MTTENIEPLSVKFINNDMVNNNKLPFNDVEYYQMFDEDNEDKTTTTWVRFRLKRKCNYRATGFITSTDNILNLDQVKDNLIRKED